MGCCHSKGVLPPPPRQLPAVPSPPPPLPSRPPPPPPLPAARARRPPAAAARPRPHASPASATRALLPRPARGASRRRSTAPGASGRGEQVGRGLKRERGRRCQEVHAPLYSAPTHGPQSCPSRATLRLPAPHPTPPKASRASSATAARAARAAARGRSAPCGACASPPLPAVSKGEAGGGVRIGRACGRQWRRLQQSRGVLPSHSATHCLWAGPPNQNQAPTAWRR
jgi:hypothetical protein